MIALEPALALPGLTIDRWLRVLPGKRYTGQGRHHGEAVAAKLFIAANSAAHQAREQRGLEWLAAANIPAPAWVGAGVLPGGGHYVLTRWIDGAHCPEPDHVPELLQVCRALGHLHAHALVHEDAHLDNFLLRENETFIIDGAAVKRMSPGRHARDACHNLALLLAQWPPTLDNAPLRQAYREAHPAAGFTDAALDAAITAARGRHIARYLAKTLRECTLFRVERTSRRFSSVLRSAADGLAPLLKDPDHWLDVGHFIKGGGTTTMARVTLAGRSVVIKRYNIKGVGHAVSRAWRPSRAWHAWLAGHRLRLLGILTPEPLALIEERHGPGGCLRGRAWLITAYHPGESLATRPPAGEDDARAVDVLFEQLAAARISHGDMKANNLLWDDSDNRKSIALIDLDALRVHSTDTGFARAHARDRARFDRNWV